MNLTNFHKCAENMKLIRENKIYVDSQKYWIMLIGNGQLTLTFKITTEDNQPYTIVIEERHIIEFKIRNDEKEEVNFYALGRVMETRQKIILSTNDGQYLANKLKILDITATNNYPSIPFITLTHENEYYLKISKPRYWRFYEAQIMTTTLHKKIQISFTDLFDWDNWDCPLYFVFYNNNKNFKDYNERYNALKFKINVLNRKNFKNNIAEMSAIIYYNGIEHPVNDIMLIKENSDNELDIYVSFDIKYNVIGVEQTYIISRLCQIVK